MGIERDDIDGPVTAEWQRWRARGQHIVRRHRDAIEPRVGPLVVPDADIDLTALDERNLVLPSASVSFTRTLGKRSA